jgi:hypothetical protein
MVKIAVKPVSISPTLDKYKKMFGHPPSPEALQSMTLEEMDQLAEVALYKGKAVQEWEERPMTKYGSTMDKLYEGRNPQK